VGTTRDRRGRISRFTYNPKRQLIVTQDPGGRVIQQQFCPCGQVEYTYAANEIDLLEVTGSATPPAACCARCARTA
jgi:YD repeat-containing protein